LTKEIDCPYKPTSRDPIHLSFRIISSQRHVLSSSLALPPAET